MRLVTWGKVNLTLSVRGLRPDGYHLLHSYVASVGLGDGLEVWDDSPASPEGGQGAIRLEVEGPPDVPRGPQNLAWKAADRLRQRASCQGRGARIRIRKAIPMAGGMGGASANAAGVLRALNELWGTGLDDAALAEIGLSLGADVPFCLTGGLALMEGIGERLTPLAPPSDLPLVVVVPGVSLATQQVYQTFDEMMGWRVPDPGGWPPAPGEGIPGPGLDRRGLVEPVPPDVFLEAWRAGPARLAPLLQNDLERAATKLCPEVGAVKEALLQAGALGAVMSGSGPTVVGLAASPQEAEALARRVARPGWDARPVGLRPVGWEAMA